MQTFAQRRSRWQEQSAAEVRLGDLRVVRDTLQVFLRASEVALTVQEFDLLLLLARSPGKPQSQTDLAQAMWREVTPERKRHLSVLVARLRSKLSASRSYQVRTVRKRGYGLMLPPRNRIEEIKLTKDGLDVFEDILRYAQTGAAIDEDDIERMKWYGVFYRRQTPGYFMLRLRVPNGILTSTQVSEIGRLSNQYGRGEVDITTRQNIQLRWVRIQDVPAILEDLAKVGIEFRQSGMDNVRNIIGCPMAGLSPDELFDAAPVTRAIQEAILGRKEFSNLPRKFNVSVSGCRHDCTTSQIHDLSLTPATRDGRPGFNVTIGGSGGADPDFARELDVFLMPEQAVPFCIAVIELFRDHGNRDDRRLGRLRWLREEMGLEGLRDAIESRVGPLEHAGTSELITYSGDHLGVEHQKQSRLQSVGCLVPVGRIRGDDLIEFGRLAEAYGNAALRLTNNQNILLVNVPAERMSTLLQEPLLQRYAPQPSSWMRRTVSCTGKEFCQFSLIDTKGHAVAFARVMDEMAPRDGALRIHWSGCARGCGQHHFGDIGLQAAQVRRGNDLIDAVDATRAAVLAPTPLWRRGCSRACRWTSCPSASPAC